MINAKDLLNVSKQAIKTAGEELKNNWLIELESLLMNEAENGRTSLVLSAFSEDKVLNNENLRKDVMKFLSDIGYKVKFEFANDDDIIVSRLLIDWD